MSDEEATILKYRLCNLMDMFHEHGPSLPRPLARIRTKNSHLVSDDASGVVVVPAIIVNHLAGEYVA